MTKSKRPRGRLRYSVPRIVQPKRRVGAFLDSDQTASDVYEYGNVFRNSEIPNHLERYGSTTSVVPYGYPMRFHSRRIHETPNKMDERIGGSRFSVCFIGPIPAIRILEKQRSRLALMLKR